MDNSVGIRQLQQHASAVVARARRGEIVTITDHGTPVAKIIPAGPNSLDELVLAGLVAEPTVELDDVLAAVPQGPVSHAGTEALRELRKDS